MGFSIGMPSLCIYDLYGCYHVTLTKYNYTAAEQYCSSMAAILATPRTAPENACAWDEAAAVSSSNYFWIGYRGGMTLDSLVGADGKGNTSFTNWKTGEPHLSNADNCVGLYSGDGLWYDLVSCGFTMYALCQAQN